jgi:DNA-binding NarL/FixJ family response regulator
VAKDASGRQNLRVLVADDNGPVRQELCELLSLVRGIEVVARAADGAEAVRLASALCPDAVLLDLEMPGIDGYRAAGLIRKHLTQCRLVALGVHGLEEERQVALQAGFDSFVAKGAPVETLLETIVCSPANLISSSEWPQVAGAPDRETAVNEEKEEPYDSDSNPGRQPHRA